MANHGVVVDWARRRVTSLSIVINTDIERKHPLAANLMG